MLLLGLVYFGNAAANYGLGFWLPTIVKGFGVSNLQTGFITAIPYVVGAFSMVLWPLLSDRMQERKWNTALAFLLTAASLAASNWFPDPVQKIAVLCICAIGLFAIAPLFWTLPIAFLSGTAAAGGMKDKKGKIDRAGLGRLRRPAPIPGAYPRPKRTAHSLTGGRRDRPITVVAEGVQDTSAKSGLRRRG